MHGGISLPDVRRLMIKTNIGRKIVINFLFIILNICFSGFQKINHLIETVLLKTHMFWLFNNKHLSKGLLFICQFFKTKRIGII